MELLKSFGWVLFGIACLVSVCAGLEWIAHLPKPWGPIILGTLLLSLFTMMVHSMRMSSKEYEERRKRQDK